MGYVYKYTHKKSGMWYIGSHNGKKKNYKGSGLVWSRIIKKYGLENFEKEILYEGSDYRQKEGEILKSLNAAKNPMSYNLKNEAMGGAFFGELNGMYGKKLTLEQKYKCGNGFRGKKRPDHSERMKGKNNPRYGKSDHTYGIIKRSGFVKGKTYLELYGESKAKEISEKVRKGNIGKLKPGTSEANKGSKNPSAKKIVFRGKEYGCIKEAMAELNMSRYKILKELKS